MVVLILDKFSVLIVFSCWHWANRSPSETPMTHKDTKSPKSWANYIAKYLHSVQPGKKVWLGSIKQFLYCFPNLSIFFMLTVQNKLILFT